MLNIKGKIIIKGNIENTSPLHIGCGSKERSDMDILLNSDGKPFIPATSLVGVLQHTIRSNDHDFDENSKRFWGYARDKKGRQSAVRCSDLFCLSETPRTIRDGIKLDNRTGMVKYNGKYDYEILERGAIFSFKAEFTFTEEDENFVKRMAGTIYWLLNNGKIHIGAKTMNGFGEIRFVKDGAKIFLYNFSKKNDVFCWLTQNFPSENIIRAQTLGIPFDDPVNQFRIDATLELKNSFIIRSYSSEPEMPDAVHIKSLDDWVMTGSSLKGAIRARAERIIKTLGKSEQFVGNLFGCINDEKGGKSARRGKVRISEIVMPSFIAELQNRIAIDRFTGGTIESALFDSMPLFQDEEKKAFVIIIQAYGCSAEEAGLLLLILKDLWTGDLAIGGEKNVGRGVFRGKNAAITWNDEKFILDENFSGLLSETEDKLQKLVDALVKES